MLGPMLLPFVWVSKEHLLTNDSLLMLQARAWLESPPAARMSHLALPMSAKYRRRRVEAVL